MEQKKENIDIMINTLEKAYEKINSLFSEDDKYENQGCSGWDSADLVLRELLNRIVKLKEEQNEL